MRLLLMVLRATQRPAKHAHKHEARPPRMNFLKRRKKRVPLICHGVSNVDGYKGNAWFNFPPAFLYPDPCIDPQVDHAHLSSHAWPAPLPTCFSYVISETRLFNRLSLIYLLASEDIKQNGMTEWMNMTPYALLGRNAPWKKKHLSCQS